MTFHIRVARACLVLPTLLFSVWACESESEFVVPIADADPGFSGEGDGAVDASVPFVNATMDGAAVVDAVLDVSPVVVGKSLYVSPTGLNTNSGTKDAPLQSIITAVKRAEPGDTIWLLDGVFNEVTEKVPAAGTPIPCGGGFGVVVPSGVTVRAVNPGATTVSVGGWIGFCLQGGTVWDIDFTHPPFGGVALQTHPGDSVVEGATFDDLYCGGGSGWEATIMTKGTSFDDQAWSRSELRG